MCLGGILVDISVVIPTKNEEITIAQFLEWVKIGAAKNKVTYEVILIDNSTDHTPQIAKDLGAQVVKVETPGLGFAYDAAKQFINGKYVFLGDADCTYDFREIGPFLETLNQGFDFVIGNRFKGSIEKNAMPKHHQYFGSPLTSLWFKVLLGIPTGDIHCGIRALRKELYLQLPFHEQGWEYASEMIVSARNLGAKIREIPVQFFKEPAGRISHHRRNGWLTPFKAGWGTLRVTWMFSFDRLLINTGKYLGNLAISIVVLLGLVPLNLVSQLHLGVSTLLFTSVISIIGYSMFGLGNLSATIYNSGVPTIYKYNRARRHFEFNLWAGMTVLMFLLSVFIVKLWTDGQFSEGFYTQGNFKLLSFTNFTLDLWYLSFVTFLIRALKEISSDLRKQN